MNGLGRALAAGVIAAGLWFVPAAEDVRAVAWQCAAKPVAPCAQQHGRLSSQNGVSLTIWLIGTTRMVALENAVDDLPPSVRRYLSMTSTDHSDIYGDFNICPLEPDMPGHLRRVCVVGAEKLVVQNRRGSRPAFRLLSTWPRELLTSRSR